MAAVLIVRPWGLFGKPEAAARRTGGVSDQPGNAARAAPTAASISAALANATRRLSAPAAGSNTSPVRPDEPSTGLPPMK